MRKTGAAGNSGEDIRSDCFVKITLSDAGGIEIALRSRVAAMYGDIIKQNCRHQLRTLGIRNAVVDIDDSGALDFVLAARIEAALQQCQPIKRHPVIDVIPANRSFTTKDRLRRSRLYLPGNSPGFMINAGIHQPDAIILDLEDSVAPAKKSEARVLVRNALCRIDFYGAERMVRINQLPAGLDDLPYIVPFHVNLILIPKCESADQVIRVDQQVHDILNRSDTDYPVYLMPIVESAMGVINAHTIVCASPNVVALAIGLEDYTADIGARRTAEGTESLFARSQIINAARAAGVQAIDSVFSDIANLESLKSAAIESKQLGFEGMGCIHPRQIKVIHDAYAPSDSEIEKAQQIVAAFDEAMQKGTGVVALGSKMIDPPVVKRAQKTIALAIQQRLFRKEGRSNDG